MKTSTAKQTAAMKAAMFLESARTIQSHTQNLREQFAQLFGCCDGPVRFPISGGVCEHWPEWSKDEITALCRESSGLVDASLRYWKQSGKRRETWLRLKNGTIGIFA